MAGHSTLVTTSWDDGHALDRRVADLLVKHKLKGTFYIAFNAPGTPDISKEDIRALHALGMEIGSHSMSHQILTLLPPDRLSYELGESKKRLEDIISAPVTALSYPLGYHNAPIRRAAKEAGYQLARTTVAFRVERNFTPLLMPVSCEFFPYRRKQIARHAVRDFNVIGLWRWRGAGLATEPEKLARYCWHLARKQKGLFHLTARSWEIEENQSWGVLESVLTEISAASHSALTNSAALKFSASSVV